MQQEALGMVETKGLVSAIEAADTMVKSTSAQSKRQRTQAQRRQVKSVNWSPYM